MDNFRDNFKHNFGDKMSHYHICTYIAYSCFIISCTNFTFGDSSCVDILTIFTSLNWKLSPLQMIWRKWIYTTCLAPSGTVRNVFVKLFGENEIIQKYSEYCKIHKIDVAIETGIMSCVHKRRTFMSSENRSLVKQQLPLQLCSQQGKFVESLYLFL